MGFFPLPGTGPKASSDRQRMKTKGIDLQRELWSRCARISERLLVGGHPGLKKAKRAFEASFPSTYERVSPQSWKKPARESGYLLVGDHHGLARSQFFAAEICRSFRPWTLGLEFVRGNQQKTLDHWLGSTRSPQALLREIHFEEQWGSFPQEGVLDLLQSAREIGCRLLALAPDNPMGLSARDRHFARLLLRIGPPVMALIGDIHLDPMRLPAQLSKEGRSPTILHQNHAPYYFELAERHQPIPSLLRLEPRRFTWVDTHPILVEESALQSLGPEDLVEALPLPEHFAQICEDLLIAQGQAPVPPPPLLLSFDPSQADVLNELVSTKKDLERLCRELLICGNAVLGPRGPVVVNLPGTNHLAEAAAKWVHCRFFPRPRRLLERSLWRLENEIHGFQGSLRMNPLRNPMPLDWYLERFLSSRSRRNFHRMEQTLFQSFSSSPLEEGSSFPPSGRLPNPSSKEGLVLLRWIGQTLGAEGAFLVGSKTLA
ncbi:MAG TPA: hypothetical protein ENK02_05305 [Planctomycetes bacterium]|nr:hypothetical protein [Planctomycetota bacterium]